MKLFILSNKSNFYLNENKSMANQYENESQRDIRFAATSRIWAFATGMLAICIPLTAVARSGPILPLAVITGAAVGTRAVWKSSDKNSGNSNLSLPNSVEALEERIANLETIIGSEDINFRRRLHQVDTSDRGKEL
ncbi:MAG TPA: hypothetical protein V6D50_05050 [Chroococcales cyanobacterium]